MEEIQKIKEAPEEISKRVIEKYLKRDNIDDKKINVIHNDQMLEKDIAYIASNNESFKNLLEAYVENTRNNLIAKLFFKIAFFVICLVILFGLFGLLIKTTVFCLENNVDKDTLLAVMINSIISFTTSFIVLPHTIASYLFNNEEEKYMTDLVKNIQEHDKSIRDGLKKN